MDKLFAGGRRALGSAMQAAPNLARGMAKGKMGKPPLRASIVKDMETREAKRQLVREQKARNVSELDRHVMQAYKELEQEDRERAQEKGK